ncbi:MAG: lipoyl domain-containing protein [Anaerolineae bacterium]|jgi:pyruvate/2-oxoglutarate dehydrogenase complex dihydrolipoamide acyltransferase (E2) component|nr:lipoyl domain-containing protein [Anaerolineae bacterium]
MALVPVYMPKFGMTMTHGIIMEWLVSEGDTVAAGAKLVVIETEKVNTEVEAPVSGTIMELSHDVEAEVEVGAVIAYIEEA